MNIGHIEEFRRYLAEVDEKGRDARRYDDNLAFLGYTEEFRAWVTRVISEVQRKTPIETNSGAFEVAERALDDITFPMDFKFESLIQNLKEALDKAIHCHSILSIENLGAFVDACAKIHADPEKTMADFCVKFSNSVGSTTKAGGHLTLQILTYPRR